MNFLIGIRRIVSSALARFNVPASPKLLLPAGIPRASKTLQQRLKQEAAWVSTTCFRIRAITASTNSRLCGIANATIGVGICLLIYTNPGMATETRELVAVQVGVYANPERVVTKLSKAGFPVVKKSTTDTQGRILIRVIVGPYASKARALSAKTALKARGWDGFLLTYEAPVVRKQVPLRPTEEKDKRALKLVPIAPSPEQDIDLSQADSVVPTTEADFTEEPITPIPEQDIDLNEADAVVSTTSELANVVGGISIGHKSMELTIRDREFTPDFTTLGFSLTRIMKRFYLTLSYEESINDDIETDPAGLIFYSRRDAHIELNYILSKRFTLSAGFRRGETDAHFTGSNDSFGTSEDGFFVAGSYAHSFGKKGTLSVSLAVADLDGEVSLTEPFVDTTAFVVGPTAPEDIEGNAVGASLGIVWAGAVSDKTRYLIGVRLQRYEFEDDVVFGGLDLSYDQDFDSISLGLVHRF